MIEAAFEGLWLVVQWPAIGFMVLGVVIGLYIGAVPGLGAITALSIMLPFSLSMDPVAALALMLGMYAVTATGDTLSSVLLGVPGTAAAQATILDGYPLAKKGQAARAFGAAFTCSAFGGVFGAFILALSIPVVRPLIMTFAQPEYFMLGVLALTMVGSLSGNSMLKGLLAAMLGVLCSTVGYSSQGGIARFTFETAYLLDGLALVPVVLGFFALPEIIGLATRNATISAVPKDQGGTSLLFEGVRDAFRHWWLVIRSCLIGVYVGFLPGVGGSIVDWVAYGHAVQSAKDKSQFGKGDIRGVIAPEAANNAVRGGDLVPTVAFGIPGSAGMAIMLSVFLIHDLTPGPQMLTTKLNVTFTLVWTLVIANILGAVLLMIWANQLAKVTFVRGNLIIPFILLFVLMGSWMSGQQLGDWWSLLLFGVLGFAMKRGGWPRPPFVIGFILGPIMENSLDISMQAFGMDWLLRPWTLALLAIVLATLAYSAFKFQKGKKQEGGPVAMETVERPDLMSSFVLTVAVSIVLGIAIWMASHWPTDTAFFPLLAGLPGLLIAAILLVRDGRMFMALRAGGAWGTAIRDSLVDGDILLKSGLVFLMLLGTMGATVLVGQMVAIPLLMIFYLKVWSRESWTMALVQAAAGAAFLYLMFHKSLDTVWYDGILFR